MITKLQARELAHQTSDADVKIMLKTAREKVKDWKQPSNINPLMTIGYSFNIFAKALVAVRDKHLHLLTKVNLIREFGKYLPNYKPPKKTLKIQREPIHSNPIEIEELIF